jgi:ADP-ribose pyrophosphatase YjhB (NUDIX family)
VEKALKTISPPLFLLWSNAMIIGSAGIVVDHYGDVLLIQRDDTRTLAPPGGTANIGELAPDTAVREVGEETGLIVQAVRLVGLYYLPTQPEDYLSLCFRCIMRGGEISTSAESPRVGFFKTNPLPEPMLDLHQERIERSLVHQGGTPYWGTNSLSTRLRLGNMLMNRVIYPWLHFRRRRAGLIAYEPPPAWQAHATVIISNDQGQIMWLRDRDANSWKLPGGTSQPKEPPWKTAEQAVNANAGPGAKLSGLSGVYSSSNKPEMTFSFIAQTVDEVGSFPSVEAAYFASGHEPAEAQPEHVSIVLDWLDFDGQTIFRHLEPALGETQGKLEEGSGC